VGLEKTSFS